MATQKCRYTFNNDHSGADEVSVCVCVGGCGWERDKKQKQHAKQGLMQKASRSMSISSTPKNCFFLLKNAVELRIFFYFALSKRRTFFVKKTVPLLSFSISFVEIRLDSVFFFVAFFFVLSIHLNYVRFCCFGTLLFRFALPLRHFLAFSESPKNCNRKHERSDSICRHPFRVGGWREWELSNNIFALKYGRWCWKCEHFGRLIWIFGVFFIVGISFLVCVCFSYCWNRELWSVFRRTADRQRMIVSIIVALLRAHFRADSIEQIEEKKAQAKMKLSDVMSIVDCGPLSRYVFRSTLDTASFWCVCGLYCNVHRAHIRL